MVKLAGRGPAFRSVDAEDAEGKREGAEERLYGAPMVACQASDDMCQRASGGGRFSTLELSGGRYSARNPR